MSSTALHALCVCVLAAQEAVAMGVNTSGNANLKRRLQLKPGRVCVLYKYRQRCYQGTLSMQNFVQGSVAVKVVTTSSSISPN